MTKPAEGSHAEGVPKATHEVSGDGFVVEHALLNQIIAQRTIDGLHEILDLHYGLLDQLRLVLLLVLFGLFGLPLDLPADAHQSQHAFYGHYDQVIDISTERTQQVDDGQTDEGGGRYGETCIDGVVL